MCSGKDLKRLGESYAKVFPKVLRIKVEGIWLKLFGEKSRRGSILEASRVVWCKEWGKGGVTWVKRMR